MHVRSRDKIAEYLKPILRIIFQFSLNTGNVPNDWKIANVVPIYKKGERSNPSNYRPVSLTCIICKLFEHIIASHIMQHLEDNNILYDLQHGFRRKQSCESQLLSLVHELMHNYDNNIHSNGLCKNFR